MMLLKKVPQNDDPLLRALTLNNNPSTSEKYYHTKNENSQPQTNHETYPSVRKQ